MIRVVVAGAAGRMGGHIIRMVRSDPELSLVGATERPGFAAGLDAGTAAGLPPAGVPVTSDLDAALARGADVLVDFTAFEASAAHAETCARRGVAHVIGSTGFTREARGRVEAAAARVPIVLSPNMSVGVNVLFALVREAARTLGDAYDVEIVEMHHKKKKDAPSGTAVRLAESAAEVDAAQALRFRVFYEEMGARADAQTAASHRDADEFDAVADHLLVLDHDIGSGPEAVVGTYRLIRRPGARKLGRFY